MNRGQTLQSPVFHRALDPGQSVAVVPFQEGSLIERISQGGEEVAAVELALPAKAGWIFDHNPPAAGVIMIHGNLVCEITIFSQPPGRTIGAQVRGAEGIGDDWSHKELKDLFFSRASVLADVLLSALTSLPPTRSCKCLSLRKDTLLREDKSLP